MKPLIITLIALTFLVGLAWLLPHSLFSVIVEIPTQKPGIVDSASATNPAGTSPANGPSAAAGGTQVTYLNVSFVIPAGLASGANSETVADSESQGAVFGAPAFTRIILKDYPVLPLNDYYKPEVRVYPAAEYGAVNLWAAESLKRIQNVLANPSAPLENASLPIVAFMGSMAQNYAAQAKILAFQSGNGVRMISQYAQYPAPISPRDSFYHYEGLTQDGKYYVVVEMPLILPVYSDGSNPGENGITYPADRLHPEEMDAYYQTMTALLDKSAPESFNPMLTQLDELVQSISVGDAPSLPASNLENTCPVPTADTSLLTNTDDGYCLLYPSSYSSKSLHYIVINPVSTPGGGGIGDAWVSITTDNAAGRTADQVAGEKIASVGSGFNITRKTLVVDNEQAVEVDGLPGQDSNRIIYMVHQDRLYTISFEPWYPAPAGSGQRTPLEHLYEIVMQSFRFLR